MTLRNSLLTISLTAVATALSLSCNKSLPPEGFFNPLIGGCQVAAFHNSQFDMFFPTPPPYLFQKSFDASGKIVTGIDCSFTNDIVPPTLPQFTLHLDVVQKGWMVLLINKPTGVKGDVPDTLGRIYLSRDGRPDSCVGLGLDPFNPTALTKEHYSYKNGRLLSVNDLVYYNAEFFFGGTDTISYDRFGNPLSFINNSYQYDYSRRVKQQYLSDDFMEFDRVFYLLQYLGFFPEVTSPPNLRTRAANVDAPEGVGLGNFQFDSEGKLISYGFFTGTNTITWNCK